MPRPGFEKGKDKQVLGFRVTLNEFPTPNRPPLQALGQYVRYRRSKTMPPKRGKAKTRPSVYTNLTQNTGGPKPRTYNA